MRNIIALLALCAMLSSPAQAFDLKHAAKAVCMAPVMLVVAPAVVVGGIALVAIGGGIVTVLNASSAKLTTSIRRTFRCACAALKCSP
jgi:hypothetical protein